MNREDVIRMAQECQLIGMRPHLDGIYEEALEHFAALIAAAEREACAKVCEEEFPGKPGYEIDAQGAAEICADAIRARGEP